MEKVTEFTKALDHEKNLALNIAIKHTIVLFRSGAQFIHVNLHYSGLVSAAQNQSCRRTLGQESVKPVILLVDITYFEGFHNFQCKHRFLQCFHQLW
jgi:hypothetical protein